MSNQEVIKIMFPQDSWNTNRALRFCKSKGYTPIRRARKEGGNIVYTISDGSFNNLTHFSLDKKKGVIALVGNRATDPSPESSADTLPEEQE